MHFDFDAILPAVRRLAADAGANLSTERFPSLTAAREYLPTLAKEQASRKAELEKEAAALVPRIAAAAELETRARALISNVEHAHRLKVQEHLQGNAKAISKLKDELRLARQERVRHQQGFFPMATWQEAHEKRPGPDAARWKELETELIPRLEQELAALENPKF